MHEPRCPSNCSGGMPVNASVVCRAPEAALTDANVRQLCLQLEGLGGLVEVPLLQVVVDVHVEAAPAGGAGGGGQAKGGVRATRPAPSTTTRPQQHTIIRSGLAACPAPPACSREGAVRARAGRHGARIAVHPPDPRWRAGTFKVAAPAAFAYVFRLSAATRCGGWPKQAGSTLYAPAAAATGVRSVADYLQSCCSAQAGAGRCFMQASSRQPAKGTHGWGRPGAMGCWPRGREGGGVWAKLPKTRLLLLLLHAWCTAVVRTMTRLAPPARMRMRSALRACQSPVRAAPAASLLAAACFSMLCMQLVNAICHMPTADRPVCLHCSASHTDHDYT